MQNGRTITHLRSRDIAQYTLAVNSWARQLRGSCICHRCLKRQSSVFPRVVDAHLQFIQDGTSYDAVFQCGIGVIRVDLLELLYAHMPPYSIGRVFDKSGVLLRQYRSIYFDKILVLHSGRSAPNYIASECPVCGSRNVSSDRSYVLRREMSNHHVLQDLGCSLYFSEELCRTFPWKQFKDVCAIQYPILDQPEPDDVFSGELPESA